MLANRRIRVRLALAIVLTALIPVSAAIVLARSMVQQSSERFFVPEIRQRLEQALGAYRELVSATKSTMRYQAAAIALDPELVRATAASDVDALRQRLTKLLREHEGAVELRVLNANDEVLAEVNRGRPLNAEAEHGLVVVREISGVRAESEPESALTDETGAQLAALFATSKERFDQFEALGEFLDAYEVLEERRDTVERTYVLAFAALLGITIVLAVGAGTLLARGVATRLSELAEATRKVAGGDLAIRVREGGHDEIAELARGFNRMLREVDTSRNRIEYLSRLASWQEMARRLAHEIKNPLTPIQLAVQEVHDRFSKVAPEHRQLLDTTLEIVETEVQTLRRLVGEFSEFARLPRSHTEDSDLFEFLRELAERSAGRPDYFGAPGSSAHVGFELPATAAPAELDRQMLTRAFVNLIRNALEATRDNPDGKVLIRAEVAEQAYVIVIDDNGPGVEKDLQDLVFEPYMTTKDDGTGLGLAIVKKIIIDHGGAIQMTESDWGGARVRIQMPRLRGSSLHPDLRS